MREFLTLDEDQSLLLPEPLRGTWKRWWSHQGDLRRGANLLKDNLVYEQPDIAGGSYFASRLSRRFNAEDVADDGIIPPYFSWQMDQQGRVEVVFSAEREPEVIDLRTHTGGEELWETLDTIRAKIAEEITMMRESSTASYLHAKGLQPLAASIAVALDNFSLVGPEMTQCERCPTAAPGVFKQQRRGAALSKG